MHTVQLAYSFSTPRQSGATIDNALVDLLEALHTQRSIQGAARALGASYRYVWGQYKRWEQLLHMPLVQWQRGHAARLTAQAERLLWAERRARARMATHIEALRFELERALEEADTRAARRPALTLSASHAPAWARLRQLAHSAYGLRLDLRHAGSMDGLQALANGACQVAGFHVPTGGPRAWRLTRALKALQAPEDYSLARCTRARLGLIVQAGNPHDLRGLADLTRPELRFVNRQPGSGTRWLTDRMLSRERLAPADIDGYLDAPEDSHMAVSAAVGGGHADVGIGHEAAAQAFQLGFVPLLEEEHFLVFRNDALDDPALARLLQALRSSAWAEEFATPAGDQPPLRAGEVLGLPQALAAQDAEPAGSAQPPLPSPSPAIDTAHGRMAARGLAHIASSPRTAASPHPASN